MVRFDHSHAWRRQGMKCGIQDFHKNGQYIKVILESVIQKVYIHPKGIQF